MIVCHSSSGLSGQDKRLSENTQPFTTAQDKKIYILQDDLHHGFSIGINRRSKGPSCAVPGEPAQSDDTVDNWNNCDDAGPKRDGLCHQNEEAMDRLNGVCDE